MAGESVGFNPARVKELRSQINDWFNGMPDKILSAWQPLQTTLLAEWVGEDEQSYESALVKKLNGLYLTAGEVVKNVDQSLDQLGQNWHNFQKQNIMQGAENVTEFSMDIEPDARVNVLGSVISFSERSISNDQVRGLINGMASKTKIEGSLTEFVTEIKNVTQKLNDIASSLAGEAFHGQQAQSVLGYLEKVTEALKGVLTAVQDLREGLEVQANTNYAQTDEAVQSEFSKDPTEEIEASISNVKWQG